MIKIPARFNKANLLGDKSASIWLSSGLEITKEINDQFYDHMGLEGWFIFVPDTEQEVEVPTVNANPDLQTKSKAQRLRNVLYVQLEQKLGRKPTDQEWTDYYNRSMEAIINKIKDTLE